jgi:hypothetical protein
LVKCILCPGALAARHLNRGVQQDGVFHLLGRQFLDLLGQRIELARLARRVD